MAIAEVTAWNLDDLIWYLWNSFGTNIPDVDDVDVTWTRDIHANVNGYPLVCCYWRYGGSEYGVRVTCVINERDGGYLTEEDLRKQTPSEFNWNLGLGLGYPFLSPRYTHWLSGFVAEIIGTIFATPITLELLSRQVFDDLWLHIWKWRITGGPLVAAFSMSEYPTTGSPINYYTDPHDSVDRNYANTKCFMHDYVPSEMASPSIALVTSDVTGDGGEGGDIDLAPLVDKLTEIKDAIDDISLNASFDNGKSGVTLRGASGGD